MRRIESVRPHRRKGRLTMRHFVRVSVAALALATTVTLPARAQENDIVQTAVAAGSFKTLAAALQAAGLVETLKGTGPFTVFAPTDEAFAKLPAGTVENLLKPENRDQLKAVLTYHVVPGKWLAKDVATMTGAVSVQGQRIDFKVDEGSVRVDEATVVAADVMSSNGVIHVIDRVLLPASKDLVATAAGAGTFKTLAKDGPFTLFAPTDDAFAKLPAGTVENLLKPENKAQLAAILKLHVVKGRIYGADALKAGKATTLADLPLAIVMGEKFVTV